MESIRDGILVTTEVIQKETYYSIDLPETCIKEIDKKLCGHNIGRFDYVFSSSCLETGQASSRRPTINPFTLFVVLNTRDKVQLHSQTCSRP
jgi:hypothetical protein